MITALLVMQFVFVTAIVLFVLLQRSSAEGISGLAGGGHGVISNKSSANFMTKATFFLAFAFMANSLALARLFVDDAQRSGKLIEEIKHDLQIKEHIPEVPSIN